MVKIWKGPEMEGNKVGILTLFVCSDRTVDCNEVICHLHKNPDIRRVYFGAGKNKFHGMSGFAVLYDYCFRASIEIVIEVPLTDLDSYLKYDTLITTFILVRYDVPNTYNNISFKTDDNNVVKIYNVSAQTSLETLKDNNLFTCDTMLMEDE